MKISSQTPHHAHMLLKTSMSALKFVARRTFHLGDFDVSQAPVSALKRPESSLLHSSGHAGRYIHEEYENGRKIEELNLANWDDRRLPMDQSPENLQALLTFLGAFGFIRGRIITWPVHWRQSSVPCGSRALDVRL